MFNTKMKKKKNTSIIENEWLVLAIHQWGEENPILSTEQVQVILASQKQHI